MNHDAVALQLWTIREAMAADPNEALRRVRAAGFAAVELAPLPPDLAPARLGDLLDCHGLGVVSIHADQPTRENIHEIEHLARVCRCQSIIWSGWPRDPRFDTLAGVDNLVAACNQAARIATDHGLRFGMHNHWWEFEPLESVTPIQRMADTLDPAIFWQLDVYWAQTAGTDPVAALQVLGDRVASIHAKDGPARHGEPMTPLGQGRVDIPRVLAALSRRVDWVIELDECRTDPLDAARLGREALEAWQRRPDDWLHS